MTRSSSRARCHNGAVGYGCQRVTAFAVQVNPQMPAIGYGVEPVLAEVPVKVGYRETVTARARERLIGGSHVDAGIPLKVYHAERVLAPTHVVASHVGADAKPLPVDHADHAPHRIAQRSAGKVSQRDRDRRAVDPHGNGSLVSMLQFHGAWLIPGCRANHRFTLGEFPIDAGRGQAFSATPAIDSVGDTLEVHVRCGHCRSNLARLTSR